MEIETALVTLMFASFIGLLFTGFPVGYSLAGIAVLFAGIGYLADEYLGAATGLDYLTLGSSSIASTKLWTTGYWSRCRCLFLWGTCSIAPASPSG